MFNETVAIGKATGVVLSAVVVGAALTWLSVALALRQLRRAGGQSWVERAAAAYPARLVCGRLGLANALIVGAIVLVRIAPDLGLAGVSVAALSALGALVGSFLIADWLEHRLCQATEGVDHAPRRRAAIFWLLSVPGTVILFLLFALIPDHWGWRAALVLAAGSLLIAGHVAGVGLVPLYWLGLLRPASPRLQAIVARTVAQVGIKPRATYELASPNANAAAWFLPRVLVFTDAACNVLGDEELAAVTAHELAHLAEPRAVFLTRVISPFVIVAVPAGIPLGSSFGMTWALLPLLLLFVLLLVLRPMGRRMEERADRLARSQEGDSAVVYASALEKIYAANLYPVVLRGKRRVHPHLYDRLIAAGVPPSYPRPAPPRRVVLEALPSLLFAVVGVWQVLSVPPFYETTESEDRAEAAAPAAVADVDDDVALRGVERLRRRVQEPRQTDLETNENNRDPNP